MKILIVEDNKLIADALQRGLKDAYLIDVASGGRQALSYAHAIGYDVILLDLSLPDINGRTVCESLRANNVSVPILVLTASVSVRDKVALLDAGADDYLTKPFSMQELRARMRALLRRPTPPAERERIGVPGLELDLTARQAWRLGKPLKLHRKDFDILEYLIRHHGATVSRTALIDQVWPASQDLWANVVDVHIKHLRDQIDRPHGSNVIQTVHGIGYRLASEEAHGIKAKAE